MYLPGLEPFSWTGWYPVVMAIDLAFPKGPPPFRFRGYFLFVDIESCSPEVCGFLADLAGSLSMACHLFSFRSDFL